MFLKRFDESRKNCEQPFATDSVRSLPNYDQRLPYRFIVDFPTGLGTIHREHDARLHQTNRMLAVASGQRHDLIENPCLLLLGRTRVS